MITNIGNMAHTGIIAIVCINGIVINIAGVDVGTIIAIPAITAIIAIPSIIAIAVLHALINFTVITGFTTITDMSDNTGNTVTIAQLAIIENIEIIAPPSFPAINSIIAAIAMTCNTFIIDIHAFIIIIATIANKLTANKNPYFLPAITLTAYFPVFPHVSHLTNIQSIICPPTFASSNSKPILEQKTTSRK